MDDDQDIRDLLASQLEAMGFDVVTAANGNAALGLCSGSSFALILTDLMMPGGNGLTFLEGLRQTDQDAIVIVITGYPALDSAVEAMQKGAYDYICKPFHGDDLEVRIKRAMETHSLRSKLSWANRMVMLLVASIPLWLAIGVLLSRSAK